MENLDLKELSEQELELVDGGIIVEACAVAGVCIAVWALCYQIGKD